MTSSFRVRMLCILAVLAQLTCLGAGSLAQKYMIVSDEDTRSIKRFDASTGGYLGEFVPYGTGGLDFPQDFRFGPDGNLYIGDFYRAAVKRYNGSTGAYIDDFLSSGASGLATANVMAFGPDGDLWVGDTYSVRRFDGVTAVYKGQVAFPQPQTGNAAVSGLEVGPDQLLYVYMVRPGAPGFILRFDTSSGIFHDVFVTDGSGGLGGGHGMAFGRDGNLYVTDQFNHNVHRYSGVTGAYIDDFVPAFYGGLNECTGLEFGPDGNLYVANWTGGHDVLRYDGSTGAFLGEFVTASSGDLSGPYFIRYSPVPGTPATDITAQVRVSARRPIRWNPTTQRFEQTVSMKNIGGSNIPGPIYLVLDSLPSGVILTNANGTTAATSPAGSPYIIVNVGADGIFSAGEEVSILLQFTKRDGVTISYRSRVLAGPGSP